MTKDLNTLLEVAREAAKQAYAPYSGYKVGSAVKCADGSIYSGCNVENASFSLSICAERTAIFKAVSEGKRDFTAIAIYVDSDKIFPPCGACRQVIHEFSPKIPVIYANHHETIESTIAELLPGAFSL
ncbi:MAG: cytidine deaminase [Candidatus Cloacimonadaceae bacterium]|nr:cytidine deaminase [Candidatus Cloacimonadaceae bacterium]